MNRLGAFFLTLLFSIMAFSTAQAEETEQFSLPPQALHDLGPDASQILYAVIEHILSKVNANIQSVLPKEKYNRHAAVKLKKWGSDVFIADLIYNKTGPGFPRWLRDHYPRKALKQAAFKEKWPWNNAYWLAFSQSPFSMLELSPTVNMYGSYIGTDKLGHFFMQGHTYFKIYSQFIQWGKTQEQAHAAMVAYGQISERTYLGILINGIYSNADLSANYAGWKFYTNLVHPVKIGHRTLPPILVFQDSQWKFSRHITPDNLLKPYFSDHMNEAWNPCHYTFSRHQIRKQIIKRCPAWISRHAITHERVESKLKTLSSWHGEDYGHWLPDKHRVSLDVCFGGR